MANYATLKAAIVAVIKANGNNAITGELLQNALIAMIESLGAEYQFAGIATPGFSGTNPGTPDHNVFYIAGVGSYPNFGSTVIEKGHIGVFAYNGSWDYEVIETGAYFDYEEYPQGAAVEFTFYDSDHPDGVIIKINKDVSGISNAPDEAISQWWAAQMKWKLQDVQGYTDTFPSLSTSVQSLGLFGVIKTGKVIDSITGANKLIFVAEDTTEYVVTPSDLPYKALANLVSVKLESGTASNVSIHVRGEMDMLISHININEIANHPAAYANAATALGDVPTLYRRKGMKVVYFDDTQQLWIEMINVDDAGANWWTDVTNNWVIEGPIETDVTTPTGGKQLRIGGDKKGNLDDVLNVNVWNEQVTEYATQAAARAAVPANKRKLGAIITYLVSTGTDTSGWMIDEYMGSSISDWTVADNWKTIGPVSVTQNTNTGNTEITVGNTTHPTVNSVFKFSDNDDANVFIKEIFIDFGTSGYTLSDVKNIKISHADYNRFWIGFWNSTYNLIADFQNKITQKSFYESESSNGIKIKIIYNQSAPIQPDLWYRNITIYNGCLNLVNSPTICAYISDKEDYNVLNTKIDNEISRATAVESEDRDDIDFIKNGIVTKTVIDKTDSLVLIDNSANHIINADGSFGTDQMYLYKLNVEGFNLITVQCRLYINSGYSSLAYAFYSSTETLDNTTFISGSDLYNGSYVEQKTFTDIRIPENAKTIVIAGRGGTTSAVVTKESIEVVNSGALKQICGYSGSKTILYVKSDGTGDFATVQEAINSISDARMDNQYEIRLCNDEIYNDVTELWKVSEPTAHNTNLNPTQSIAAIIPKDWITIVGYNHRRKIYVNAPDTMAVTSQQYIQCMYLMGSCIIDNIDFVVKNGRYAIHQESGGSVASLDYNARTIMRNSNVVHLGNVHGTGYWGSCYAQANGACPGLQLEYHNVIWSPAFYMHQNANFDSKNKYLFKNCRILYPKNGEFDGVKLGVYIGMNGSGQNSDIEFIGCDMPTISFSVGMMEGNLISNPARDIRTMIPEWKGYGNNRMVIPSYDFGGSSLAFRTDENNINIKVVGGTAKPDIYGEDLLYYDGTNDAKGYCCGTEFYGSRGGDYSYSLAHRLGNCANNPKTLIVEINNIQQLVTFDENFVTSDGSAYTYQTAPAYSDGQILSFINNQLSGAATIQYYSPYRKGYPMNDVAENGVNYSNNTILFGAGVKRDVSNPFGWVNCDAGETPDGIACERINPNGNGLIALIDKNYFEILYGISVSTTKLTGTMLKIYGNGEWAITTNPNDAVLIAIATNIFAKK